MSFCCLTKGITLKICRSCVNDIINKHYFKSFICLDLAQISSHYDHYQLNHSPQFSLYYQLSSSPSSADCIIHTVHVLLSALFSLDYNHHHHQLNHSSKSTFQCSQWLLWSLQTVPKVHSALSHEPCSRWEMTNANNVNCHPLFEHWGMWILKLRSLT